MLCSVCEVGYEIRELKLELKKKRSLLQMDELKCRKRVLRRMGYATAADVIELKGRVACEVSRCCTLCYIILSRSQTIDKVGQLLGCGLVSKDNRQMKCTTSKLLTCRVTNGEPI